MARPDSLIPGNYYFFLCYYDEKGEIPQIETWIYREQFSDENGRDFWRFSEPNYPSTSEEDIAEMVLDEGQLLTMFDIRELQDALLELEDSYPGIDPLLENQNRKSAVPQRTDFSDLEKSIDEFLSSEVNTLTVTIRYTNHGMSLVKRDGGLDAVFFIHWKIEPEIERKLRTFFVNRNIPPDEDYCASRPRIRVLNYPLPMQRASTIDVAVNIFKDVYQTSTKDELKFQVKQIGKK